jgi:UDPglucose 6-dehydrogenase
MNDQLEPIGVIGVGWVGLVTAACFAELGHEVWARDIVPEKIKSLERGEVPIHEPGLAELVAKNVERLHFTTDMDPVLEHTRLLFVCVDTPPTYSGDADLSRVEAVLEELGDSSEHALVMKSTVPVGTGRSIQRRRPGTGYVSNPEFLKEGTAVQDFLKPDRVVIGADEGSAEFADRVEALYAPLGGATVRTDVASGEMIKLASNAFLATKISFINEIANVSEDLGADVSEVARGMGLDDRIGPDFLRAGIGYGGSCVAPEQTVLARHHGRTILLRFDELWARLEEDGDPRPEDGVITPAALEVLSWLPEHEEPRFLPVMCVTRRDYDGELLEIRTKMGRRLRCTPDHPLLGTDDAGAPARRVLADEVTPSTWLPLSTERDQELDSSSLASILSVVDTLGIAPDRLIVRPRRNEVDMLTARSIQERREIFAGARLAAARTADVKRTGALRYDESVRAGLDLAGATFAPGRRATPVPRDMCLDQLFWRVAGLYVAEGCAVRHGHGQRLIWSFHREREQHLVEDVMSWAAAHGISATNRLSPTSSQVYVDSRLLTLWWLDVLGFGRTSYEQRLPDLVWDRPEADKWALLAGLFEGDGSWSLQNGGPSVVIEFGTVSDELADGVMRLLGEVGILASRRVGRSSKSTKDTHWLRICGADQVERAIELVPVRDRREVLESIARQSKRIAPTGYRRSESGSGARVRVAKVMRERYRGPVFSLEVPGSHSFVTNGSLVSSNCFPKDVQALKQLAGNTGYHFQLLTAVIEVNELQKRRTIGKLQKHLGSLVGRQIALLGVAFKPHTDDIREATSLVLSGRLAGEGAHVRVYDPVAASKADGLLAGAQVASSALDAVDGADAVVLVTEWPEFAELDWGEVKRRMRTPIVIDGRNFLDREALRAAGFTYEGIGR